MPTELDRDATIYIAGHRGLVGSALWRRFEREGFANLVGKSRAELDLTHRRNVFEFFESLRPGVVILAAAKVGGILANSTYPADFLSENLQIQTNVLDAALNVRVPKLLFLGSSCIYPKFAEQPIREDSLLTGPLEPTNDAYAIAKIAGILNIQAVRRQYGLPWISGMPTNLYGPGDNFSAEGSHLLPALIRRYETAKNNGDEYVINWGSGTPRRELMHVDDMAAACLHLLENYDGDQQVNIGTGRDHTVSELADIVANVVGFEGEIRWDPEKPDGTPRKVLDVGVLERSGWQSTRTIVEGIADTVDWYRQNEAEVRV
ncbi:GDP-L-fucose synthase [Gordonia insulae]|uniref:GDP-L-fucose synthase n=2 Tax=Gordonia insulae TaxID=2420509 RepID=A0A3G8JT29_9ACTN|nr:GDP-L-fucose synthase [Gordonia insulae]